MELNVTLRDVISAVSEFSNDENEIIATVLHMVRSGQVRLAEGSWSDEFAQSKV